MAATHKGHDQGPLMIPEISKEDLFAFHEAHFGQTSSSTFDTLFLNGSSNQQHPDVVEDEECYDDDDLGYYEDGTKRTLTDDQIAIFRHSELEALRREQEKLPSRKLPGDNDGFDSSVTATTSNADFKAVPQEFRSTKKKKKKAGKRAKPEPKPDLRKRTWDIVDKGLDSLDYD